LFTADALNLNSFVEGKERATLQFHTPQMQDKFRERMEDSAKSDSNMIFSEDVKNMLFLAEGNDRDLNLLTSMLERYLIH
jgi:pentatricopeptide repeat domain-containing protein 2